MKCLKALLLMILSGTLAAADETARESLSAVQENLKQKKAVLVDVRELPEWNKGHLEGAVLLPLTELRQITDRAALEKRLPQERLIYTYCAAGKRSVLAAGYLEKLGYQVRPLKSGYRDLLKAGFHQAKP